MRYLLLLAFVACGAPEDIAPPPAAGCVTQIGPWLVVTGVRSSPWANDWYPTTLSLDTRTDAWHVRCQGGSVPVAVSVAGELLVRCGVRVTASP